jgi:hypothetical protein
MLLSTTTFVCTPTTGPKFWLAWSTSGDGIKNSSYSYIEPGLRVSTGQLYLEIYDTETDLANRVDALKGITNWYWECENRIPYPTNPNEWECVEIENLV